MSEIECKRTLVKSPPELWAELSDAESLARHLGEFGEIRITRVEPETTVAWEGERASGTVEIEPSGWGTKVRFVVEAPEPAADEARALDAAPAAEPDHAAVEPPGDAKALAGDAPAAAEPEAPPAAFAGAPSAAVPAAVNAPSASVAPAANPPWATVPAAPTTGNEEPTRRGWLARLFGRRRRIAAAGPVPVPAAGRRDPESVAAAEPTPPAAEPEPEPVAAAEPEPVAAAEPEPEPVAEPEPAGSQPGLDQERTREILSGVLDDLGAAHHRPFSRG